MHKMVVFVKMLGTLTPGEMDNPMSFWEGSEQRCTKITEYTGYMHVNQNQRKYP